MERRTAARAPPLPQRQPEPRRWRFTDVTAESGLGRVALYGMGVAVGDVDGDARPDLLVTAVGENRLLRNVGGRRRGRALRRDAARRRRGRRRRLAHLRDLLRSAERDGDLDLFVCRYVRWSRQIDLDVDFRLTGVGPCLRSADALRGRRLGALRNDGTGRFVDISAAAGIRGRQPGHRPPGREGARRRGARPRRRRLDVDLLVANDTTANFLFRNRGDRTFEEIGTAAGVAFDRMGAATGAMGIDVGAFRDAGELAIAIGNFANEMTSFYVSQGDGLLWADEAIAAGIGAASRRALTFGLLFADLDLDGRLDLVAANGHLESAIAQRRSEPELPAGGAALLERRPGGAPDLRAPRRSDAVGDLARPIAGRGLATADFDGDGDPDLVLTQVGGPPLLLRNDQRQRPSLAQGPARRRGRAIASPTAPRSSSAPTARRQRRTITATRGYLSQSETVATFGLGDVDRRRRSRRALARRHGAGGRSGRAPRRRPHARRRTRALTTSPSRIHPAPASVRRESARGGVRDGPVTSRVSHSSR